MQQRQHLHTPWIEEYYTALRKMRKGVDKRIKSLEQRWRDDYDPKIRNARLSITAGHYINLYQPPMRTSAVERLKTESYNKLMTPKDRRFDKKGSIADDNSIDEDRIQNNILIDRATQVPSANLAEQQFL